MRKVIAIAICLAAVSLFSGCDLPEELTNSGGVLTFTNDLEGVNFINECLGDWDCTKGLLISTVKGPNNESQLFGCEVTNAKELVDGGKLNYAIYEKDKKLLTAYYDITWLDYGSWAFRPGTATVSFYTNDKH